MKNQPITLESVWNYPRPPRLEATSRRIRILQGSTVLADTTRALRILETSHPPVYYLPLDGFPQNLVQRSSSRQSFCEFKGFATYWNLSLPTEIIANVAWSYESPSPSYAQLAGHLAFYASRLAEYSIECWVGEERVLAQQGDFYGGWITSDLRGPFKGAAGTRCW